MARQVNADKRRWQNGLQSRELDFRCCCGKGSASTHSNSRIYRLSVFYPGGRPVTGTGQQHRNALAAFLWNLGSYARGSVRKFSRILRMQTARIAAHQHFLRDLSCPARNRLFDLGKSKRHYTRGGLVKCRLVLDFLTADGTTCL